MAEAVDMILKAILSCDITWDPNCCPIDAHWRFGKACNCFWFKFRYAIHHFKLCQYASIFKTRRLLGRITFRRRIWWLLHCGKLILNLDKKFITSKTLTGHIARTDYAYDIATRPFSGPPILKTQRINHGPWLKNWSVKKWGISFASVS